MILTFDQILVILGLVMAVLGSTFVWIVKLTAGAATVRIQLDGIIAEKFTSRIAAIEGKVDIIWGFQRRRAIVEGLERGIGTLESPFQISEETKLWLVDIQPQLQKLYQEVGQNMSED